jgi:hypothetical protein
MQAPKEIKEWVNRMRSAYGKKNGCIDGWFFDAPDMERKIANSKRNYRRAHIKRATN